MSDSAPKMKVPNTIVRSDWFFRLVSTASGLGPQTKSPSMVFKWGAGKTARIEPGIEENWNKIKTRERNQ